MAPKRKPTPSVASSNPTSPRTPVAHKQKKLNPPRLCVQTAIPFTGRMTRGRSRKKIPTEPTSETDDSDVQATTETETQDEEDDEVQVQIPKSKSVSMNARKKSIEESFELLTLKNKNPIPSLTTEIKKISINSQSSQDSRGGGSIASQGSNSKTTDHKKTVTYVLPRVSESDGELQETPPGPSTKTPHKQGFKTPVRHVPSTGSSKRDIAELDKISLIDDTMADNFECFTRNVLFRDFELTTRESLVAAHSEVSMKMQELRRLAEMSLIGFSAEFLEYELADVLAANGNRESLEDIINMYADKENKDTGDKSNNVIDASGTVDRNSAADTSSKASFTSTKDFRTRQRRSDADDEDDSITSASDSPDIFRTPKKQVLGTLPPLPPKTLKSAMKKNNAPFLFPNSRAMSSGSSEAENPAANNVFVFGSEATQTGVKVPRPVRPGEIAFSQTGSPIVSARDALILPSTPVQPAVKTVRIQVENGDGRAIEVDIVYRGNPEVESDAKLFRAFMTDVRGVVTARSTARGKRVLPPHVPPKKPAKTSAQKAVPSGAGLPKKPQWL